MANTASEQMTYLGAGHVLCRNRHLIELAESRYLLVPGNRMSKASPMIASCGADPPCCPGCDAVREYVVEVVGVDSPYQLVIDQESELLSSSTEEGFHKAEH